MELLLILIASISPIVAGCFALRCNHFAHRAAEAVACLDTATRELQRIRGLRKATMQRNDELTANTIELQNEMNIAIGRLELLERVMKTKTRALTHANGELANLRKKLN